MAHEPYVNHSRVALAELDEGMVTCRMLRQHAYDPIDDDGGNGGMRTYKESRTVARKLFRCERCGLKRYEVWSKITGERLFYQRVAPPRYHLSADENVGDLLRLQFLYQSTPTRTRTRAKAKGAVKKGVVPKKKSSPNK